MVVDPITKKADIFGKLKTGTFKWTGGCEYKGRCYGFPRKENSLLVIDQKKREAFSQKLNICYRGEHHYGGVLTPGGVVYQPPRNTDHVLKIDLNTYETDRIDMPCIEGTCRYSSSVLHPSGEIYLIPEFGYRMAVLDPDTEEIHYFGEKSGHLVFGAVVGIDGNIYGFFKEGKGILKVDVKNKKTEFIHEEIGNPDCYGSVVGINGKIYGVPGGGNTIWEFDVRNQTVRKLFEIEERGYAKCAGGGVGADGTIVMMPCFGGYVYFLKPNRVSDLSEAEIGRNCFFSTSY